VTNTDLASTIIFSLNILYDGAIFSISSHEPDCGYRFQFFLFTNDLWSRLLLRFESCVLLCLSRSGGVQDAPVSMPISAAAASRDHVRKSGHLTTRC